MITYDEDDQKKIGKAIHDMGEALNQLHIILKDAIEKLEIINEENNHRIAESMLEVQKIQNQD